MYSNGYEQYMKLLKAILSEDSQKVNKKSINDLYSCNNIEYTYQITEIRKRIEKALSEGNKELFLKLSHQYNMLLAEA